MQGVERASKSSIARVKRTRRVCALSQIPHLRLLSVRAGGGRGVCFEIRTFGRKITLREPTRFVSTRGVRKENAGKIVSPRRRLDDCAGRTAYRGAPPPRLALSHATRCLFPRPPPSSSRRRNSWRRSAGASKVRSSRVFRTRLRTRRRKKGVVRRARSSAFTDPRSLSLRRPYSRLHARRSPRPTHGAADRRRRRAAPPRRQREREDAR